MRTCRLGSWPVSPIPEDTVRVCGDSVLGRAVDEDGEVGRDLDMSYLSTTV